MSRSFGALFFKAGIHVCEIDKRLNQIFAPSRQLTVSHDNPHLERHDLPLGDELVTRMSGSYTWRLYSGSKEFLTLKFHKYETFEGGLTWRLGALPGGDDYIDIADCWFGEDDIEGYNIKLGRQLMFYNAIKDLSVLLFADLACGIGRRGTHVSTISEAANEKFVFKSSAFVFRPNGWQKLIRHLEKGVLLPEIGSDDFPRFIFRNTDTGEEFTDDPKDLNWDERMCPRRLQI